MATTKTKDSHEVKENISIIEEEIKEEMRSPLVIKRNDETYLQPSRQTVNQINGIGIVQST